MKITKEYYNEAKDFIFHDIQREIDLAKSGKDAGNFLCALALLCYTEFAGGLKRGIFKNGESRNNFNHFFNNMGQEYKFFLQEHKDLYDNLRCGLTHVYFPKKESTIQMLKGLVPMGVVFKENRYYFIVEKYFEDFKLAFKKLESEIFFDK